MNIGYAFWGHLADVKYDEKGCKESTPDGNASYVWTIINALTDRKHKVYRMMPDRDKWAVKHFRGRAFKSFAMDDRYRAYKSLGQQQYHYNYPDLDMLILEWRWIIPEKGGDSAPDRIVQNDLLNHYCHTKTKVVIFDLDYKFTEEDYNFINPHAILDCGYKHLYKKEFVHVNIPFDFKHMFDNNFMMPIRDLIYVGNRYERDRHIEDYIVPLASKGVDIKLFGNWLENGRDSKEKWPMLDFGPRINVEEFYHNYACSRATLLLAKDEYCKYSFMTMRLLESLFYNCCPIGLSEFVGIEKFLPDYLIATDVYDVLRILTKLRHSNTRALFINELKCNLEFMDARHFVKKLESL